ncbi:hypothetical protein HYO62_02615 [Aerococcaceae bacterium DSM 111022]|nr:hypothetical protein [Aerococcaceae bacterium DSM 111022]
MLKEYQTYKEQFTLFYIENSEKYSSYKDAIDCFNAKYDWAGLSERRPNQFKQFLIFEDKDVNPVLLSNIMKSIRLSEEAELSKDKDHRQRLAEEALNLWPNNHDAIRYIYKENIYKKIIFVKDAIARVQVTVGNEQLRHTFNYLDSGFSRLNIYLAELYMKNCLYKKAKCVLEYVLSFTEELNVRAQALIMICDLYMGNYEEIVSNYHHFVEQQNSVWFILPTYLAAVLDQDEPLSLKLFERLMTEYESDIDTLYISGDFSIKRTERLINTHRRHDFYEVIRYLFPLINGSDLLIFYFDSTYQFFKLDSQRRLGEPAGSHSENGNVIQISEYGFKPKY